MAQLATKHGGKSDSTGERGLGQNSQWARAQTLLQAFLTLTLFTLWSDDSVRGDLFTSGLSMPVALSQSCDTQTCLRILPNACWGQKPPSWEPLVDSDRQGEFGTIRG